MELPAALRSAVDAELAGVPLAELRAAAALLSQRYRAELRDGRLHMASSLAVKAYLAARLPATYAAVRTSLAMIADVMPDFAPLSLLDVGAGPGTALWAARDCWPSIGQARMLEASAPALMAGRALAQALHGVACDWVGGDAARDLDARHTADLVMLCYVLDELEPAALAPLVERLWARTGRLLVLVEPGTPAGWRRILTARSQLVAAGAHLVAPCAHAASCPIQAPDWCHFARRVARSRVHRLAKEGDVPFEDEKFIFIAASRTPPEARPARVLARPRPGKAWIDLKLCNPDGSAGPKTVRKRDGDAYRAARRLDWGDALESGDCS